jgi:hypothetical protein
MCVCVSFHTIHFPYTILSQPKVEQVVFFAQFFCVFSCYLLRKYLGHRCRDASRYWPVGWVLNGYHRSSPSPPTPSGNVLSTHTHIHKSLVPWKLLFEKFYLFYCLSFANIFPVSFPEIRWFFFFFSFLLGEPFHPTLLMVLFMWLSKSLAEWEEKETFFC